MELNCQPGHSVGDIKSTEVEQLNNQDLIYRNEIDEYHIHTTGILLKPMSKTLKKNYIATCY